MPYTTALDMGTNSKFQPSLSSTSDLPTPVPAPATASDDASPAPVENGNDPGVQSTAAAPAPDAGEPADDSATSDTDTGTEPAAKPHSKGGFQKRIDELTKQREEFRREKEEYARRLDEALGLLREHRQPVRTDDRGDITDDARPNRDQFDDPDQYVEAVATWSTRQAVKQYEAEQARKAQEARTTDEFQKALTKWHEGRTKAIEKYPDFESIAEAADLPIPQHVGMALLNVPNGHDVMYWMGQHPEEARRIAAMGIPQAVLEIGILSQKISAPRTTSKAPAPPTQLAGNRNGASAVSPDEDPNYMENRLAEMRGKKKP
jgi:hypothetical protein